MWVWAGENTLIYSKDSDSHSTKGTLIYVMKPYVATRQAFSETLLARIKKKGSKSVNRDSRHWSASDPLPSGYTLGGKEKERQG